MCGSVVEPHGGREERPGECALGEEYTCWGGGGWGVRGGQEGRRELWGGGGATASQTQALAAGEKVPGESSPPEGRRRGCSRRGLQVPRVPPASPSERTGPPGLGSPGSRETSLAGGRRQTWRGRMLRVRAAAQGAGAH